MANSQTKSVWRAEWERLVIPHLPRSCRTLDCGCGPAYYRHLFGNGYVGVDIQRKFPSDHQFIRASVFNLPFSQDTFDLVFAQAVLEHLDDPEHALVEIQRVTKKGGCVVLGVPSRLGVRYENLRAFRGYNIEELELMALSRGFRISRRFTVGGVFSMLYAEIERALRTGIEVKEIELPSFEGEQFYVIFSRSVTGRLMLKIRQLIVNLLVILERNIPSQPLYQGSCVLAMKTQREKKK